MDPAPGRRLGPGSALVPCYPFGVSYRRPGRSTPRSPDIDSKMFQGPKGPLVVATTVLNAVFAMWIVWTCETGTGRRQLTFDAKIAITAVTVAALMGALAYAAVQKRRLDALAARLLAGDADGVAAGAGAEVPRVRVQPVEASEEDELADSDRHAAARKR